MKTEFPRQNLAAAAQFMADRDVRYYLKGVYVEALPNETRLTARSAAWRARCATCARTKRPPT